MEVLIMTVETITIKPNSLYHHKVEGYIVPSDIYKFIVDFWRDNDNFEPKVNVIWDLRKVSLTNVSFETADHIANTIMDNIIENHKPGLTAILIEDNPEKHLAAYLANLLDRVHDRKVLMFHHYEQALNFIEEN
ncbi:MAG: hypothetical protein ACI9N9_001981 [Enterobacterales bacterium]|jgi:hypothetical protein